MNQGNYKMTHRKLSKAPLQEVVFELRWEGEIQNSDYFDEGYDIAVGVYHKNIKESFPIHKKLFQEGITVFGLPMHQYWKGEQKWPVVQHGPCVMAVNDIEENYTWEESFKPLIFNNIKELTKAYEKPLKFNQLSLLYIDIFKDLDDVNRFVSDNLNISFNSQIIGFERSEQFNFYHKYVIDEHSTLNLTISTANSSSIEPQNFNALMVNINFIYAGYFSFDSIEGIIEKAHSKTSSYFKNLLKKEYYDSIV